MKTYHSLRTSAVILVLCALFGCDAGTQLAAPEARPVELTFEPLSVPELLLTAPGTFVFTDEVAWSAFWHAHTTAKDLPPAVEFEQKMIVGVARAARSVCEVPAGIDAVPLIESIWLVDGVLEVRLAEPAPVGQVPKVQAAASGLGLPGQQCTTWFHPMQFVMVERFDGPIYFVKKTVRTVYEEPAHAVDFRYDPS